MFRDQNNRFGELEIEDSVGTDDLLELEPDDDGITTGQIGVVAGRSYYIRLKASDDSPVNFSVDLALVN
jgi:hypothetical protein